MFYITTYITDVTSKPDGGIKCTWHAESETFLGPVGIPRTTEVVMYMGDAVIDIGEPQTMGYSPDANTFAHFVATEKYAIGGEFTRTYGETVVMDIRVFSYGPITN